MHFLKKLVLLFSFGAAVTMGYAQSLWQQEISMCAGMTEDDYLRCRLESYMHRFPESQLCDVYKYCFQDYFGLEHILTDSMAVVKSIEKEINGANRSDWDAQPFYYPLLNNEFVRVDLSYVRSGIIPMSVMASAMLQSSGRGKLGPKDIEVWSERWHRILSFFLDGVLPQPRDMMGDMELIDKALAQGQYAFHHSRLFNSAYHQHYRIVHREVFERMILPFLERSAPQQVSMPNRVKLK